MRIDLKNACDRKFLQDRVNPLTGKTVLQEQLDHEAKQNESIITHGLEVEKLPSLTEQSRILEKRSYNKFRNTIFEKYGVKWRSIWECDCYVVLRDMERRRRIFDLKTQVKYEFTYNGKYLFKFIPDFQFDLQINSGMIVPMICDAKSEIVATAQKFKWQVNAMSAFYDRPVFLFMKGSTNVERFVNTFRIKDEKFFRMGGLHR